MEWNGVAASIFIVVTTMGIVQDFAKASQLGLWSGPGGAKASQLWSGELQLSGAVMVKPACR